MAYVNPNFKTKKALKEAVAAGKRVTVFQPAGIGPTEGEVDIEGPHYPKPHMWYGVAVVKNGRVVKVR